MTTTAEPLIDDELADSVNRPMSALSALLALLAFVALGIFGVKLATGSDGDPPRPSAAQAAAAAPEVATGTPTKSVEPPPKNVPLRPPPNDACVDGDNWCGKQIGYASIIVDVGRRDANMPKRAWVIAVATAMQESTLKNQATKKYAVTERFPFDKYGADHDSVGLFQQRPSQNWGDPDKLMDPRYAAGKFYDKLKRVTKNWDHWEDPKRVRLTEVAQKVQISGYPEAYQKHEANATKIVDLVLQYTYEGKYVGKTANNKWFVMVQCGDPKAKACRSTYWQLTQPVVDNHDAFKKAFPEAELNDHLGDARHENDSRPQDHTPIAKNNTLGWVYAQDFGNGKAKDTGFDLNHFARWLLDEVRADPKKYPDLKYVITTIPSNKGVDGNKYYGIFFHTDKGWDRDGSSDHENHIHLSFRAGFERANSTIVADYLAARGKA